MPQLTLNGARIHYEESGTSPQAIVFARGLLWSGRMFDAQVAALSDRCRCVTFDFRRQGRSDARWRARWPPTIESAPPETARHMHREIPGSRLVTIEGAGHSSAIEEPDAVNRAILGSLAEIE